VWWYEGGDELLFDLAEDPGEYANRAADPACAAQLERLRGLLMAELHRHRPAWCDGDRPMRLPRPVIDEAAARRSAFAGHMWDHHPNDAMH
jgi:hypothetical protein